MDINSQLKETQMITGEKSFGMKMSQGKLERAMSVPGVGVGAPEVNKSFRRMFNIIIFPGQQSLLHENQTSSQDLSEWPSHLNGTKKNL